MVLFKREKVLNVFRKGKFKLLTLTETKLKGNGDLSVSLRGCVAVMGSKLM